MNIQRKFVKLLVATSALAVASGAYAQEVASIAPAAEEAAPNRGLEEIVVTARRSSERLINVPVAVTALSAAVIERAHVTDLTQVAQMTPNLIIASATSGTGGSISIRGVGTSFLDPGLEQSVGINVDGVAIGRGHFLNAAQFDLKQIEVLKGPQALFFGKNSPAGVISITSADPTPNLSAMARVGYEFEAKERYVEGYVAGPLSDTLGFRVAAKYNKLDGWIKNRVTPGPNPAFPGFNIPGPAFDTGPESHSIVGRVTLKWQPTSDFTANLKFTGNKLSGGALDSVEAFCTGGVALARGTLDTLSLGIGQYVVDPQSDCKKDRHTSRGEQPKEFLANWDLANKHGGRSWGELDTYITSLNLNYTMGPLTLTSISGYTNIKVQTYVNADNQANGIIMSSPTERGHTIAQELRLQSNYQGPLNFTFGGFFESARRINTYQASLGFVGFDPTNGGSIYTFKDNYHNRGKTYSAFGQLRWKITDQIELAGGTRYTHEEKHTVGQNTYRNALGVGFGLAPVGAVLAVNTKFSNWSPEVTLRYKPTNNVMTYVAYKTGYKSGGVSTPATLSAAYLANPSVLAFKPERSKGFEAGIKAELLDRTVRFDATIYRYNFSNLQLTSFDAAQVAYFIKNAGKARTTGVESSVVWQVTQEFSLNGGAAYNKAKFVSFQNAQCYALLVGTPACPNGFYDRSGQPLPRAPKTTFSAGFNYERPIGADLKAGVTGEGIHTSSYVTSEVGNPLDNQNAFWRLNASVRIGAENDRWELALIGRNLTNKYITVISGDKPLATPGQDNAYTIRPREIAVQGTVKF